MNPTETDTKKRSYKILWLNAGAFIWYFLFAIFSDIYGDRLGFAYLFFFALAHSAILLLIGTSVSFREDKKSGSIYFAALGLTFVLFLVGRFILYAVETPNFSIWSLFS